MLLIAQLKDSPSPWARSLPKVLIVKKGMTGEGVAMEYARREWGLDIRNAANAAHR